MHIKSGLSYLCKRLLYLAYANTLFIMYVIARDVKRTWKTSYSWVFDVFLSIRLWFWMMFASNMNKIQMYKKCHGSWYHSGRFFRRIRYTTTKAITVCIGNMQKSSRVHFVHRIFHGILSGLDVFFCCMYT